MASSNPGTLVLCGVDATDAAVAVIAYRRRLRDEAHDIAACAPAGINPGSKLSATEVNSEQPRRL